MGSEIPQAGKASELHRTNSAPELRKLLASGTESRKNNNLFTQLEEHKRQEIQKFSEFSKNLKIDDLPDKAEKQNFQKFQENRESSRMSRDNNVSDQLEKLTLLQLQNNRESSSVQGKLSENNRLHVDANNDISKQNNNIRPEYIAINIDERIESIVRNVVGQELQRWNENLEEHINNGVRNGLEAWHNRERSRWSRFKEWSNTTGNSISSHIGGITAVLTIPTLYYAYYTISHMNQA